MTNGIQKSLDDLIEYAKTELKGNPMAQVELAGKVMRLLAGHQAHQTMLIPAVALKRPARCEKAEGG